MPSTPELGPVPLGPFDLERPIGKGGMAEVWLGTHRAQQQKVAVKVLTGERAREEAFIRALRNEIHSVARLHHPGIILLFDTGEVDDEAERFTGGRLAAGSPWFAMELASHGALSPRRLPLPWPTSRMLLLSLLDALAHAHARGVVHRDLKPGNILLCAPNDPRPGLKLTDFGIAAPLGEHIDGEAEQGRLSGTPRYMAPEQFQAKWRDFGPWTDLYALGCIAYQLATGKAPFTGDALKLAIAHCHDAAEPPSAHMKKKAKAKKMGGVSIGGGNSSPKSADGGGGFPPEFDAWVLRLLEKDPQQRFTSAADAAWALLPLQLPGEDEDTVTAGWEQALRSLKPLVGASDLDETAAVTLTPGTRELAGSAGSGGSASGGSGSGGGSSGGDDAAVVDASAVSTAVARAEQTALSTVVDRPSMIDKRRGGSGGATERDEPATVGARGAGKKTTQDPKPEGGAHGGAKGSGKRASGAGDDGGEDDDKSTQARPALASMSSESSSTVDVPPEMRSSDDSLFPKIPPEPGRGPRGTRVLPDEVPALGDTTFAPNVPWTELAAMSPKDSMPTQSGRSIRVGTRRHEPVDESMLAPRLPPPMPPTWRRPGPQAPSKHLLGAGLGLYGLRQIPLVDRDAERDVVWDTLRAVHDGGGARVVVIRGPSGIGKTRLAEWLVEQSSEVGAGVPMRAGHGPSGGPLDGLAGLIAMHARAVGLEKRALQRRLVEVVRRQGIDDVDEALALAGN